MPPEPWFEKTPYFHHTEGRFWRADVLFSSGEDPLTDDQNEHDINSVAGVLKLYFRGLENPLFPKEHFLDFISTISESQAVKIFQTVAAVIGGAEERKHTLHIKYSASSDVETHTEKQMEAITDSLKLFNSKWGCITLLRSFTTELFPCCFCSNSSMSPTASGAW